MPPLPWGVIGACTYGQLTRDRRLGIIREQVGAGVAYHRPPLPAGALTWAGGSGGPFEMALDARCDPAGDPTLADLGVRSLEVFRDRLSGLLNPDESKEAVALRWELDELADRFLELVAHLHERGCQVGLLHPRSILFTGSGKSLAVHLPDLGFIRPAGAGKLPGWLDVKSPLWQDWRGVFAQQSELTATLQVGDPAKFNQGPVAKSVPDLQRIAWLFAWLLRGQASSTIPTRDDDPSTHAEVWNVLTRVAAGQVATARQFQAELRRAPLSDHFRPEKKAAGASWTWWVGTASSLLIVLGGLAATTFWAYLYATHNPAGSPPDPVGPVPSLSTEGAAVGTGLQPFVDAFRQAATLKDKYQVICDASRTRRSVDDAVRKRQQETIQALRYELLQAFYRRLGEIIRREENTDLGDSVRQAEEIRDLLLQLPQEDVHPLVQKEEQECLRTCQEWIGSTVRSLFEG
jgi:hypothetical protein